MARKKHCAEQIVAILRQIEVELANHKSIGQACKEAGINQQTYYPWRKEREICSDCSKGITILVVDCGRTNPLGDGGRESRL
jgi:Transposase